MLRDKVTEFFVEMDDFCMEFASQLENRPLLEDPSVNNATERESCPILK